MSNHKLAKEFVELHQENKRLKEEYIMLQNASEEYEDKLLKENQRLKDRIDFYEDIESDRLAYIDELKKENQRLNDVLNELEKWLEDKQDLTCGCGITADYIYAYENVLDYLSELKESDK